jgi:hypothetical protein
MRTIEWLGRTAGVIAAPIAGGIARVRHARTFHPEGVVHRAEVQVHPAATDELRAVGERLAGPAIVRLSSAWWKHGERPDLLGVGIRIGDGSTAPQDLLFATARSMLTLLPATLTTNVHDFLANDYFGIAPFEVEGLGRVRLRLRGQGAVPDGSPRDVRLLRAIESGAAVFDLEIATRASGYRPCAQVVLHERIELDDNRVEMSPDNAGRGIRPIGFVNAIRLAAYAASRRGRGAP